jgi:hypothetical protein
LDGLPAVPLLTEDNMSKFTLTMEAGDIPDGTTVRKPQGLNTHRLQRYIRIYASTPTGYARFITPLDGTIFLIRGGNINEIPMDKKMCIDFHSPVALQDWIKDHFEEQG